MTGVRDDRLLRVKVQLQLAGKSSASNKAKNVATNFNQVKADEVIRPNLVLCDSGVKMRRHFTKLDGKDRHTGHELDGMAYDGQAVEHMVRRDAKGAIVPDGVKRSDIVKPRPNSPFKRAKGQFTVVEIIRPAKTRRVLTVGK